MVEQGPTDKQFKQVLDACRQADSQMDCQKALGQLIDWYGETANEQKQHDVRQVFLKVLERWPGIIAQNRYVQFLIHHIEPKDLAELEWQDPRQVLVLYEAIYSVPFHTEEVAALATAHIHHLMRSVLDEFEEQGRMEELFRLLQIGPGRSEGDYELQRLRNRAKLYERQKIQKRRKIIYAYLVIHVVLVVLIFPYLFIWAENGALQRKIGELTETEVKQQQLQFLSYTDGVYWSLITAAAIGYGDITPETKSGKMIAAVLGVLGVITVGVIAGLLLSWITPRRLE